MANSYTDPPTPMYRPSLILKLLRAHVLKRPLLRLPRTDRVLDLCCGWGFYFVINPRARGIDADPACVADLTKKGYSVDLHDVRQGLPYSNGAFDWVVASDVLEHFVYGELESLFAEVHRVLTPEGRVLILVPNRKGYERGVREGVGHKLFIGAREIGLLAARGFSVTREYSYPLPQQIGKWFADNKQVFELCRR